MLFCGIPDYELGIATNQRLTALRRWASHRLLQQNFVARGGIDSRETFVLPSLSIAPDVLLLTCANWGKNDAVLYRF